MILSFVAYFDTSVPAIITLSAFTGFFFYPSFPTVLELACEVSFPVGEVK
jgi:hypothetical protein